MTRLHVKPNDMGKQLLKKLGIKLSQMSLDTGIELCQLSRILTGWSIPRNPEVRQKIAQYLETDEATLWPSMTQVANGAPADDQNAAMY